MKSSQPRQRFGNQVAPYRAELSDSTEERLVIMAVRSLQSSEEWSTNAPTAGRIDPEEAIGGQIRELRKIKGLTLNEVATQAGVSVGYLSQIERNQSKLPIGVLKKLSDVLGVQMNWFFQGNANSASEERDIIVRKANRRQLTFTGLGIVEDLLSPNLRGPLELLL